MFLENLCFNDDSYTVSKTISPYSHSIWTMSKQNTLIRGMAFLILIGMVNILLNVMMVVFVRKVPWPYGDTRRGSQGRWIPQYQFKNMYVFER